MAPSSGPPSDEPVPVDRDLVWGIVVAGGSGARFGTRKQLASFRGKRVIDWSLDALRQHVAGLIVVVPADLADGSTTVDPPLSADVVVAGGVSRSESVRSGLAEVPDSARWVLVHDAARPLADSDLVTRVLGGLADADAVVPVVPVTDSLRSVYGGGVDRADFVAVQTPQGFSVEVLRAAHAAGHDASDDASLVDQAGGAVTHVDGDARNLKITVPHDLVVADVLLKEDVVAGTKDSE